MNIDLEDQQIKDKVREILKPHLEEVDLNYFIENFQIEQYKEMLGERKDRPHFLINYFIDWSKTDIGRNYFDTLRQKYLEELNNTPFPKLK